MQAAEFYPWKAMTGSSRIPGFHKKTIKERQQDLIDSALLDASDIARLARECGGFIADADEPEMIGQIQIVGLQDLAAAEQALLAHKRDILVEAGEADPGLTRAGGGPPGLEG